MIEILRRMLRSPQGALGLLIVGLILLVVIAGPWFAPQDPEKMAPLMRYKPPSAQFWLGTDQYGRDILSRLLHGARATVLLAVLATALGTLVGAVIGTVSAFLGGRSDEAIMRTVDAIMSIPSLLLALLIVNLLGKSSLNALFAIALAFAPGMARVTRSVALSVRKQDYVNAAIARGESAAFIVGREMLPNVIAPIIVEMTIRVAFAVMLFATLSFLGLGAQPPASEWGLMVSEARRFMHLSPWMILWPSLAVALVAIGFNLLGDGLRDVLNPRS
ncbi:putative D,D-dipeptide transport system permease protein DdpC [Bosea sp. 62]|uniref:ABC transporter permease n=1 Tax=unclassified Bosea (in: a-proteobacteria) TaxID=2653178 RepID=UPI00125C3A7E|nr:MULTISPECIES: ABC transporter permease [unclassified Bosea (in: a-proteobacteria)]CAD5257036.1 putative D,D-dipeptide transport system permease protein DdpC [Bosea sp. 46]CAD5261482.1 putative D,D-dipeptide transport system permease protein DdpC [Bosea sp. 21B]CAD5279110.1 putative D,D-dipeptide transport system permease protein DdpC [Bosea sp. 7B]VVT58485.1 putative D,D-dipeptide transport system permease protein DdpC [Bosea sp. EC-HK365B]VXB54844.1 putative D,D-dipeptide transport system 